MPEAYRIVDWDRLYEVNAKGGAYDPNKPGEELRATPFPFVRWRVNGRAWGEGYQRLLDTAGVARRWWQRLLFVRPNKLAMMAFGLFAKLVEIAADNIRGRRGWILDGDGRLCDERRIATMTGFPRRWVRRALALLTHPEVNWVELCPFHELPESSGNDRGASRSIPETSGNDQGASRSPLYKPEPEPEYEREERPEPEKTRVDARGGGGQIGPACPAGRDNPGSALDFSSCSGSEKPAGQAGKPDHRSTGEPVAVADILARRQLAGGLTGAAIVPCSETAGGRALLQGVPEVRDAAELAGSLAKKLELQAPPGFDPERLAVTREQKQFKADVSCLWKLATYLACGRLGRPGEAIKATEAKCRELAASPSTRTTRSRMKILIAWAKNRLRKEGHRW